MPALANRTRCLALPFVALTLAACGSSDEGSNAPPSRGSDAASDQLSKTELIAQADKICSDTAEKIRARPMPTSLAEIAQFSEDNANANDEGVRKLRALTPPDSLKADYEAFTERAEMVGEQARDVAEAARTNDVNKLLSAAGNVASDVESLRLARKIGFKVCRSGPVSPLPPGGALPEIPSPPPGIPSPPEIPSSPEIPSPPASPSPPPETPSPPASP